LTIPPQESGRFFVKKLRKKLLLISRFRNEPVMPLINRHPRLPDRGVSNNHALGTDFFGVAFFQKSGR